jgi:hypothetical protein
MRKPWGHSDLKEKHVRTREEHLEWCKQRAREYLQHGDVKNAVTSMLSDLGKHPQTKPNHHLALLGLLYIKDDDVRGASRFIEGFR